MTTLTQASPIVNGTMTDKDFRAWQIRLANDQPPGEPATPPMAWRRTGPFAWGLVNLTDDVPTVDEPRPTADPDFVPTVEADAEWLGLTLADAGETPLAPRGWDFDRLTAFFQG